MARATWLEAARALSEVSHAPGSMKRADAGRRGAAALRTQMEEMALVLGDDEVHLLQRELDGELPAGSWRRIARCGSCAQAVLPEEGDRCPQCGHGLLGADGASGQPPEEHLDCGPPAVAGDAALPLSLGPGRTPADERELRRRLVTLALAPLAVLLAAVAAERLQVPGGSGLFLLTIGTMALARFFGTDTGSSALLAVGGVVLVRLLNPDHHNWNNFAASTAYLGGITVGSYVAVCEFGATLFFPTQGPGGAEEDGSTRPLPGAPGLEALIRASERWSPDELRASEVLRYVYERVHPEEGECLLAFGGGSGGGYVLTDQRLHTFSDDGILPGGGKRRTVELARLQGVEVEGAVWRSLILTLDGGERIAIDEVGGCTEGCVQLLRELADRRRGDATAQRAVDALLERTYQVWRERAHAGISVAQSKAAAERSPQAFACWLLGERAYLAAGNLARAYENDEHVVGVVNYSYICTNKAIYLGGDAEHPAAIVVTLVRDVRSYSVRAGWTDTATLEREDGHRTVVRGASMPGEEFVRTLLSMSRS